LHKLFKHFFARDLSATAVREITDALVIFSISMLAYVAIADWDVLGLFYGLFRIDPENASFLYFLSTGLVVFSIRRIADQKRERIRRVAAEHHAHIVSIRDPLTQLPNRHQFETEVTAALKTSNNRASILLLGLNQFKKLNNLYGHLGCDAVLSQVAERIRDRVTSGDLIARIGDDEFALCLAHADRETAGNTALALIKSVKEPVQIGIEYQSIGASVGIAQVSRGPVTVGELLRWAHVALSRARNTHTECCFFDPEMDAHVREQSNLEKDLRAALGGHEIRPYYQPIIDLKSKRIVSFESLARWRHPVRGFVPPDTLIPLAEELGLMEQLSGQLFGDACRDAATWPDDISLSFNFSPSQISDRTFANSVLTVLHDNGMPAHRLEAEITESALATDLGSTRQVLQTLRNSGVRIVIDDFGTGYSSFYHLYELQFDKLKIDKRFIQELGTSAESDVLIRAIIGLSKGLDLRVTTEGVETAAQAKAAFQHGAHQAQGFLFGKAIAAGEVSQLFYQPTRLVA